MEVSFNRKDAAYCFKASILDLFDTEPKSVRVRKTGKTQRMQRRRFVRLDISGHMRFRVVHDADGASDGLGPELSGRLLNISAGGVLFETFTRLKAGSILILHFSLKRHYSLKNILAIVKRCEGSKSKGYLVGAEFLTKENYQDYNLKDLEEFLPAGTGTFDENLQKLVFQFIYRQQIELRKKGLLEQ